MADTIHRDETGKLPAYAWPGGYPIFYLMADCQTMCPDCANGENGSEARTDCPDCPDDKQWHIVSQDVNWEDADMICCHCGKQIESAYADFS